MRQRAIGARIGKGLAALLAFVAVGCGSENEPRPATTASPTQAVAYRITERVARSLPEVDAFAVIEREGDVVAETQWEDYTALVLMDWLDVRHGIRLEAPEYRSLMSQEEGLLMVVVTGEHADALRRLDPSEATLRRYYAQFTAAGFPEAGEAMLDWLRVFRRATESADEDHVVVFALLGP